jgi:hypothetical protein
MQIEEELESTDESTEVETTTESNDTRDIIERELDKAGTSQEEEQAAEEKTIEDKPKHNWSSWKREAAEELEKLPDNVQKHIIERESQFHKGLEQYREAANFAKTMDKAIAPHKEYLNQLQVTPDIAFRELLKTEKTLRTGTAQEKIEMFQKLAHDYQIDVGTVINTPFNPQAMQYKDQLAWTQSQLEQANDFKQSHEEAQINAAISDFGQQHEHFEDVRLTMADLLEKGLANDLNEAYAKAVRLNDDVFTKLQTNSKTNQLNQANQAAKAARQSAVQVKGALSGIKHKAIPANASTEDIVRMSIEQLGY